MGAWGTGIFENDVAADVRGEWEDAVASGSSASGAAAAVIEGIGAGFIPDEDDGPVFWIALAALQIEAAQVTPDVAAKAAESIPANLARWREEATEEDFAAREQVLRELEQRLRS
jgi:formaldehyde-activating enzyme involved in methanogenesis